MTKPQNNNNEFPAATGAPTFYRTYSRRDGDSRESYFDVYRRSTKGLEELGQYDEAESLLVRSMMLQQITLPSGRWMWVGGTDWSKKPENTYSCYNCNSTNINDVESFGLMMSLGMMGCGTGAVLEERHILQLPPVRNTIQVCIVGEPGSKSLPVEATGVEIDTRPPNIIEAEVTVGDSRQGWVDSMMTILRLAFKDFDEEVKDIRVFIDLSFVRPDGTPIKGFGGVANPVKLSSMYERIAKALNRYVGKQLDAEGVCLLLDEPAKTIVAGNVRRYAGMRQFSSIAPLLKDNLWQQGADGTWKIDPERDALRMANHTRVFHTKPTLAEVTEAVRKQYESGEGAIQWAGEAVARGNCDLLDTDENKQGFLQTYNQSIELAAEILKGLAEDKGEPMVAIELEHRMQRYALNPCGEIISSDFLCNLAEVHLNQLSPRDLTTQRQAFEAGALSVAALLHHVFPDERYRISRELDPIVAVCPTGLFDFFVNALGVGWLRWWESRRDPEWDGLTTREICNIMPLAEALGEFIGEEVSYLIGECDATILKEIERMYLCFWRECVGRKLYEYCDKHGLKRPNRYTAFQPSGTKSLLTGASSGWHPPKAQRYIRRITFAADDPVAKACIDYGYSVVPSQSCKDDEGRLLDDISDPRVQEWLVEIPVEVSWANLPGADKIDINKFSAVAQFDFVMQCQQHYTMHNTSATIELREDEIDDLAKAIYDAVESDSGYISAALLPRFDPTLSSFPRLPFEPIDECKYERLVQEVQQRQKSSDFHHLLARYDKGWVEGHGVAGCDSDKCMLPESR